LGRGRSALAWSSLVIIVLITSPVPFSLDPSGFARSQPRLGQPGALYTTARVLILPLEVRAENQPIRFTIQSIAILTHEFVIGR
jgi:hypothetical protein